MKALMEMELKSKEWAREIDRIHERRRELDRELLHAADMRVDLERAIRELREELKADAER